MSTVAVLTLIGLLGLAHASLPANLGPLEYIPGDVSPSFSLPLVSEPALQYNAWSHSQNKMLPLIVFATDATDPFSTYMWKSNASIASFLHDGPSGVHHVLSSWDHKAASQLRQAVLAQLSESSVQVQHAWDGMLHFTNGSISGTSGSPIAELLAQWPTPRNELTCGDSPATARLDCHYGSCGWPAQDSAFELTQGGVACLGAEPLDPTRTVLLSLPANCTPEDATRWAAAAGAKSIILIQRPGKPLVPVGADGSDVPISVSMVSIDGGNSSAAAIADGVANCSFHTTSGRGQWMALDHAGRLVQVGWEKYATLRMLSWEAQYLSYGSELAANLSSAAFIVPVMDKLPTGRPVNITLPSQQALSSFGQMQLEVSLSCAGNMDRDCSVWDRIVSLSVDCGAGPMELGRWINAFQRRDGHWLTEAPFLPLLYPHSAASSMCQFVIDCPDEWLATVKLRFPAARGALGLAQPKEVQRISYPNPTQGFSGPAYNQNRTVDFTMCAGCTKAAVAAIITGHGGCEFQPTSHHFVINEGNRVGKNFSTMDTVYFDRFMQAGSALGCADKTSRGAVPNEHGTWYYGRNGWCDGMDVKPVMWDVSKALIAGKLQQQLRYYGYSYQVGGSVPSQDGCGGQIDMSSYLLFW